MTATALTPSSLEADYEAIEAAVMETEKGRWFLAEYASRHRAADTEAVLAAIGGLEKLLKRERRPDIDRIRLDIGEMKDAIERTKLEIAQIKHDAPNPLNRFEKASSELDAIVSQTEAATSEILGAAEKIQEYAFVMREAGVDDAICDEVETLSTTIYMACSFQDLTGQRTQKVVHVLRYLENRIDAMMEIWGLGEEISASVQATPANPEDTRPDAHLLNGPALDGEGIDQSFVDDMFGDEVSGDFDFDAIDIGTDDAAEPAVEAVEDDALALLDAAAAFADPAADEDALAETDESADSTGDLDAVATAPEDDVEAPVDHPEAIDAPALAAATAAMEQAIETLTTITEVVAARDPAALEDPLARLSRGERQALFS